MTKNMALWVSAFLLFSAMAKAQADTSSLLATGRWIQIAVSATGMHQVTNLQLSQLGLDPAKTRIYGRGGAMLPKLNAQNNIDQQLQEVPTLLQTDGILFFAEGPGENLYDEKNNQLHFKPHFYEDYCYYFLTEQDGEPARISPQQALTATPAQRQSTYLYHAQHQLDNANIARSGELWLEPLSLTEKTNFSFPLTDLANGATINCSIVNYVSSSTATTLHINFNNNKLTQAVKKRGTPYYEPDANVVTTDTVLSATNQLNIAMELTGEAQGAGFYLDYISINTTKILVLNSNGALVFYAPAATNKQDVVEYAITCKNIDPQDVAVWETAALHTPKLMNSSTDGDLLLFKDTANSTKRYVVFTRNHALSPIYEGATLGEIAHQNIRSIKDVSLLIIAPQSLSAPAEKLADLHRKNDNMQVAVAHTEAIYNAFSSGMKDVSAIRNFIRRVYQNSATIPLNSVLLMGDCSSNPKADFNLIPNFQSANSLTAIKSYMSDDFFGLMDDSEGSEVNGLLNGDLELGIGRIPVRSLEDANTVVNKIADYMGTQSIGNWRTKSCFVADDRDYNLHINDAERLISFMDNEASFFNPNKVYIDAFLLEVTLEGNRAVGANQRSNLLVNDGLLFYNYTGHGTEINLCAERVVSFYDIQRWHNKARYPIFVTASCEFSRFDGDAYSGGEVALFKKGAGAIALLSTTRVAFSTVNFSMNKNFYRFSLRRDSLGYPMRLGDIIRETKNNSGQSVTQRNFSLLGDPAMRLNLPLHKVETDQVNGLDLTSAKLDYQTLDTVNIRGHIESYLGDTLSPFNGFVDIDLYNKPIRVKTNGFSSNSKTSFLAQESVLASYKTNVVNGFFALDLVLPAAVGYQDGPLKLAYYAYTADSLMDAAGAFGRLNVSKANRTSADKTGPEITAQVSGGTSPVLSMQLTDPSGISTANGQINQGIWLVVDGNHSTDMSHYFEPANDQQTQGQLNFALGSFSEGTHTGLIEATDRFGNTSTAQISFTVVNRHKLLLDVYATPNPTGNTAAFTIKHNRPGKNLTAQVEIFTVEGGPIATLSYNGTPTDAAFVPFTWDGNNTKGEKTEAGLYLYKAYLRCDDEESKTGVRYLKLEY